MTETIAIAELTFQVIRSSRRQTAEISVERDGSLVVRAPTTASGDALQRFAHQQRGWVYEKLAKRELLVGSPPKREFVVGESFLYLGRAYRLALVDAQDVPLKLRDGRFQLRRSDVSRGRDVLVAWYTAHAQAWLEGRVESWSERLGTPTTRLRVRDLGYRWGSCGAAGLNFHWATITLPPGIVDYVIVHELAHVEHPHHGQAFWEAVGRALPDHEVRKRWLAERGAQHGV
ncbi:MAG: SprT family zinc-dependent metalloprotease [Myxococcota bacterium]